MAGGRPKLWNDVKELEGLIKSYWEYCDNNNKPLTMAGLAFYIGVDRKTLYNYGKDEQFFPTIKKARDKVAFSLEETAIEKGNAGTIFVMKNYGYKDKQEIDHSSNDIADVTKAFLNGIKQ